MEAQLGALDVVAKFGAKDDLNTDLSKPLLDAWKEACASPTPSTIVIPKGTYLLSQATLEGPCKAPIELQVQGNIKAPADPKAFKEPKWVSFLHVENFKLFGGGAFDGQGTAAYKREGCEKHDFCSNLPINIRFDYLTNAMIQDITIRDSKQFHANVLGCKNITFESVTVSAPEDSPNTDGIHIGRSDGVKIINTNIKLATIVFQLGMVPKSGHHRSNLWTRTRHQYRIKTWAGQFPGTASDMHFEDITVNNYIDLAGRINVKLSNISFKNIHGTAALPEVVKLVCSGTFPCENVELADIDITFSGPNGPAKSECKMLHQNYWQTESGSMFYSRTSKPYPYGLNVGL
ncbi:Polygalacturonase [Hibiscus syriacus]|uniref:Polygalacturonase n=1 Tax=Hibiscus syriacus TaxID=106335 RepID=A0A6A2WQS4_HIBSY|nr:Polygalacturonase [Hibiscus syriacus]